MLVTTYVDFDEDKYCHTSVKSSELKLTLFSTYGKKKEEEQHQPHRKIPDQFVVQLCNLKHRLNK